MNIYHYVFALAFFGSAFCQKPTPPNVKPVVADAPKKTPPIETKSPPPQPKRITIDGSELQIAEGEQSGDTISLSFPNKLDKPLVVTDRGSVIMLFRVRDEATKDTRQVAQAFARFTHSQTQAEVFAGAEVEAGNLYRLDIPIRDMANDFSSHNGLYSLHIDVADGNIDNPLSWHVADVDLSFANGVDTISPRADSASKPEIHHKFREPEKRPPKLVSTVFVVLALFPMLLLWILWGRVGVNLSNMPIGLSTLVFHGSLIGVFVLYYQFWVRLDMFQTINYLAAIGCVLFISGNFLLRTIASRRKE